MNENEYGVEEDGDDFIANLEEDDAPEQPPTFTELLSQFVPTPSFTQLLSQPMAPPPHQPPQPSGSTRWDLVEDIAMISSVLNTSCDPIVGTNQKYRVMWSKVMVAFEEARAARPHEISPRTLDMVKSRWGRVSPIVLKWAACLDEAKRRKPSGQNDEGMIREAHMIFGRKWGKFNFFEQWKVMKLFPKWRSIVRGCGKNQRGRPRNSSNDDGGSAGTGSSGKRSRGDFEDYPDPDTPTSVQNEEGNIIRPGGNKAAKAQLKGKGKKKISDEAIQTLQSFTSRMQLSAETRERIEMEKLAMQREKEARRQKQLAMEEYRSNFDMLQTLQRKEFLLPWEEKTMNDLNNYFNNFSGFNN